MTDDEQPMTVYHQLYDSTLCQMLMRAHKREFVMDYYLEEIVRIKGDKWLLRWTRRIIPADQDELAND